MNFQKYFLSVLIFSVMAVGTAQATDPQHRPERRYDFNCSFEHENHRCMALASIYTRHRLDGPVMNDSVEDPSVQWASMERLAVFCEGRGLVYANGADKHFRNGELHITAEGGVHPKVHVNLPLKGSSIDAELFLRHGRRLNGSCSYDSEVVGASE